jgi:flagellar biosynthesis/type III secretory pathway protein FliH
MSSFDALVASDGGRRDDFSPFCPAAGGPEPATEEWRPLFDRAGAAAPPAADEPGVGGADESRETASADAASFAAGYEQGQRDTRAAVEQVAAAFVQSVEEVGELRGRLRRQYGRELLELTLDVARKVLCAEVTERPDVWLAMIQEATRQAVNRETVRIRVPALLAAFLTEHFAELRMRLDGATDIEVVEDPTLGDGACVVETRLAEIDLGIDTQLGQVARALSLDRP